MMHDRYSCNPVSNVLNTSELPSYALVEIGGRLSSAQIRLKIVLHCPWLVPEIDGVLIRTI